MHQAPVQTPESPSLDRDRQIVLPAAGEAHGLGLVAGLELKLAAALGAVGDTPILDAQVLANSLARNAGVETVSAQHKPENCE